MRPPTEIGSAFPLLFSGVLGGIDTNNLLPEEFLDGLLDLELVCPWIDAENVLVMLFSEQTGLLCQSDIMNQTCRFVHTNLSASFAKASLVTIIFWNPSSCSAFTSAAVFNKTGWIFRAAL